LAVAVAAIILIAAIELPSGLLEWRPDMARLSPFVFAVPALTEELFFRGPLPARGETARPIIWLTGGVAVFTLWHVAEPLFLAHAQLFRTPAFLACAATIGTACAVMRYRTGSLWPAVLFHGAVVMVWQVLFGGPTLAELR
ncbi:MAG: CPBP family intramembrane metalloprotease, partial [Asticcacaulis sp.]|nr:CPBP family intramembrane metalloprotease [Asticcacaulis sp.]